MSPNTFRAIAYTFAVWTVLSILLGSFFGWILYRCEQRSAPKTPLWPWER